MQRDWLSYKVILDLNVIMLFGLYCVQVMNSLPFRAECFYTIAVGDYQFLYLTVKVQRELFFCALQLQKNPKLTETVLGSVVKPSLCKAPLWFCHHGND